MFLFPVWAVFWHGAVSRYTEGNWNKISIGNSLEEDSIYSIELGPEGDVWLGSYGRIYKYEDEIWTTFTTSDGLPDKRINELTVSLNGDIWAGTSGGGICCFDGNSWTVFTQDDGLADNVVKSIAFGPGGEVWIGTHSGVSRYEPFSVFVEMDDFSPSELNITSIFPNPFNLVTNIQFNIPRSGILNLEIFNIMGQKVRTIHSGILNAGTHSIRWDGKNDIGQDVSSGVYFGCLKTGTTVSFRPMMLMK